MHAMISSARRTGSSKQRHPNKTNPGNVAMNEIDNHADTIWKLLEMSGENRHVFPFSADYQPKPDVPIAKCATLS